MEAKEAERMFTQNRLGGDIPRRDVSFVSWQRVDLYPAFRAEWREDKDDLVYNFYHKRGPDPGKDFGDPEKPVHHGELVFLPKEFAQMLQDIIAYVFDTKGYELEYVEETLSWQLRVTGAARKFMQRKRFTHDFMAIVDANIPQFCPPLLSATEDH